MKFNKSDIVTQIVWQMRLADWPRAQNRARIQSLFNGDPPYTQAEIQDNLGATNVNDLSAVTLSHDARKNFANAFQKPGRYFAVRLNAGPAHKKDTYSEIITEEITRIMKRSRKWFETQRSTFANVVLYGIGPCIWMNRESWCPQASAVGDMLIPSGTLLEMENLPFLASYHRYTAAQLKRMTSGPNVDKGWNVEQVQKAIRWADSEAQTLYSSQWPEVWSPERIEERIKEDAGLYSSDAVPTIDCYDFRFWSDEGNTQGWRRRIIVDPWGGWAAAGGVAKEPTQSTISKKVDDFLFSSEDRIYGEKLDHMAHFQYADLSAYAPFRYHSVRSLGFIIYALAHVNNRLWCRFLDSTFESMMQYFRVNSDEDVARALKVNLVDKGFIDKSLQFVPPAERWQVNEALVEMAIQMNEQKMGRNARSLAEENTGKTDHMKATVYVGEMNKANALVTSAMDQAYNYEAFKYEEICRRFCIKNSSDPDVIAFQAAIARRGVPEKYLNVAMWDVEPERTMGGGNPMLEQTIAQQLMQFRPLYDPDAQRIILRKATMAITGDPELTDALVPDNQVKITNSVADTQRAAASLLLGLKVDPKPGENHQEVVQTILSEMAILIKRFHNLKPTMEEMAGLQNMGLYAQAHLQMLAQDVNSKPLVEELSKDLKVAMDTVGEMSKELMAQQQAAQQQGQNQNGDISAETAAKIQSDLVLANAKAQNARESHAQRTAERATQFQVKAQQDAEKHQQQLAQQAKKDNLDLATQAAKDAQSLHHEKKKAEVQAAAHKKKSETSTAE